MSQERLDPEVILESQDRSEILDQWDLKEESEQLASQVNQEFQEPKVPLEPREHVVPLDK